MLGLNELAVGAPAPADLWQNQVNKLIQNHFLRPEYQRVLGGRPLVYLFAGEYLQNYYTSTATQWNLKIAELRSQSIAAGAGDPYIVFMNFYPDQSVTFFRSIDYDAVSRYAAPLGNASDYGITPNPNDEGSLFFDSSRCFTPPADYYSSLTSTDQQQLTIGQIGNNMINDPIMRAHLANNQIIYSKPLRVVPLVSLGWDYSPLKQNRDASDHASGRAASGMACRHFSAENVGNVVLDAMNWVLQENASLGENSPTNASAILIYAWNEYLEGGFLGPTLGEGPRRLQALRKVRETHASLTNIETQDPLVRPIVGKWLQVAAQPCQPDNSQKMINVCVDDRNFPVAATYCSGARQSVVSRSCLP